MSVCVFVSDPFSLHLPFCTSTRSTTYFYAEFLTFFSISSHNTKEKENKLVYEEKGEDMQEEDHVEKEEENLEEERGDVEEGRDEEVYE